MTGPTTVRVPAGRGSGNRVREGVGYGVLAVVALTALWGGSRLVAPPRHVDRITFVNPTAYNLRVDATGRDREGW